MRGHCRVLGLIPAPLYSGILKAMSLWRTLYLVTLVIQAGFLRIRASPRMQSAVVVIVRDSHAGVEAM